MARTSSPIFFDAESGELCIDDRVGLNVTARVASVDFDNCDEADAIADGEHLARCWNSHDDLTTSLADVLRILEAVRMSAGLGTKQIARMEAAKAVLAKAGA
jgi:hypothetical protein